MAKSEHEPAARSDLAEADAAAQCTGEKIAATRLENIF
jgi:hypothetical protein